MDKLESAIRLAAALYDRLDRKDIEGIAALLAEDCRIEPAAGAPVSGIEAGLLHFQEFLAGHPGAKLGCEELLGFGHRCVARWRLTWVDEGGRELCLRGLDIIREKDERIREILSYVKVAEQDRSAG
jgi:hypothetical protein